MAPSPTVPDPSEEQAPDLPRDLDIEDKGPMAVFLDAIDKVYLRHVQQRWDAPERISYSEPYNDVPTGLKLTKTEDKGVLESKLVEVGFWVEIGRRSRNFTITDAGCRFLAKRRRS